MPKYGPHLPDIEKKVRSRLAALALKPKYVFDADKHQERFYTAPCRDAAGGKVVFKMRTEDFVETKEYFRREIEINRMFAKRYKKRGKLSVPRFIEGDSKHVPEWMVYEFIEGYESGDFYNGLLKNNIKSFPLPSLMAAMKNIRSAADFAKGEVKLKAEKHKDFIAAFEKDRARLETFFTEQEIVRAEEILRGGKKILDAKNDTITHGDFHPGNLIITPAKEIAIIDWYYVHLNNFAFDIAFLYLEIANKKFRKKVLESFVDSLAKKDRADFWILFRLDILRLVPHKISVLCDALYKHDPVRQDYYDILTEKGVAKLEANLDAFKKALEGSDFI